jgi:hypothetical protein
VHPSALPAEVRERFSRVDHRGSYLQMHFALDGMPTCVAPYDMLKDPGLQSAIGVLAVVPRRSQRSEPRRDEGRDGPPGDREDQQART